MMALVRFHDCSHLYAYIAYCVLAIHSGNLHCTDKHAIDYIAFPRFFKDLFYTTVAFQVARYRSLGTNRINYYL